MAKAPKGRRPLLRRRLGALGAALTREAAAGWELTRSSASHDATAGHARAVRSGDGEAAIPASKARAPAVGDRRRPRAVCCCCSLARADDAPPPATNPTSTTPNAPPPDPYHPPAPQPKPKPDRAGGRALRARAVVHTFGAGGPRANQPAAANGAPAAGQGRSQAEGASRRPTRRKSTSTGHPGRTAPPARPSSRVLPRASTTRGFRTR